MIRDRIRQALRAVLGEAAPPAPPTEVNVEVNNDLFTDTSGVKLERDCYLYITVGENGETWEMPLTRGSRLVFSVESQASRYCDLRGCDRRED